MINIEIVYDNVERQEFIGLKIPAGTTAEEAIIQSGIIERFPELSLATLCVGIFSKKINLNHVLQSGDRIEIYRPLLIDPKQARRVRARK
ncbi:MAG: RnfH family protein [Legionellales bacterium]|nr:RnfH family protein [Legionellales bacterium]